MKTTYIIRDPDTGSLAAAIADTVMWPKEGSKYCIITRINVMIKYRGEGYGTEILNQIIADADAEKVTLLLEPSASGGLSQAELVNWYERHGFKYGQWSMGRRPATGNPVMLELGDGVDLNDAQDTVNAVLSGVGLPSEDTEAYTDLMNEFDQALEVLYGRPHA